MEILLVVVPLTTAVINLVVAMLNILSKTRGSKSKKKKAASSR